MTTNENNDTRTGNMLHDLAYLTRRRDAGGRFVGGWTRVPVAGDFARTRSTRSRATRITRTRTSRGW